MSNKSLKRRVSNYKKKLKTYENNGVPWHITIEKAELWKKVVKAKEKLLEKVLEKYN
jgi:hypothetical protein